MLPENFVIRPFTFITGNIDPSEGAHTFDCLDSAGNAVGCNYLRVAPVSGVTSGNANWFLVETPSSIPAGGGNATNNDFDPSTVDRGLRGFGGITRINAGVVYDTFVPDQDRFSSFRIKTFGTFGTQFSVMYGYAVPYNSLRGTIRNLGS